MPSPVPVWPRFLLSGEGVVRTREGWASPAPCDPNSRVPQLPRGVIYSQASYCFDIVACTVPFLFFFPVCFCFCFLSVAKYLRRNCTDKGAVYLHANKVK